MSDFATKTDIDRLERHLQGIGEALQQLVRVEERQVLQAQSFHRLEEEFKETRVKHEGEVKSLRADLLSTRSKLDAWVNRGVGAWAVVVLVWAALNFIVKAS